MTGLRSINGPLRILADRRLQPFIVLAALGLALWSWTGGLWDVWNEADAWWIQSVREAIADHDWSPSGHWPLATGLLELLLRLNHNVVSVWALRLPSVIFGIVVAIYCCRIGMHLYGEATGWLAGLAFVATAGLVGAVPTIEPGMMFTAWVVIAADAWLQRVPNGGLWRRIPAAAAMAALATLTGGWAGPAIIAAIMLADLKPWKGWVVLAVWIAAAGAAVQIDSSQWEIVLPAIMPPIAIGIGRAVSRLGAMTLPRAAGRHIAAGVIATELLVLAMGLLMYREPDWFWERGFFILNFGLFWLCLFLILVFLISLVLLACPRTGVLIAGCYVVLLALNPVVLAGLKPAMNPSHSAANVSDLLDHYLDSKNARVGVVGEADDPRLHVHGRYRIQRLPDNPRKFVSARKVPDLLIGRRDDMEKLAPVYRKTGYTRVKTITSMNRTFWVARRHETAPQKNDPLLRFAFAGDTGTGNSHQYNIGRRMAEQHDRMGPLAACLMLGDNLYGDDSLAYALQTRFLEPFAPLIERGVPFYAALGNHDYSPWRKARFELQSKWFNMGGKNYYARTFGHDLVTVFFIDCEVVKSDPAQYLWLENELRNCHSSWKILVNHIPMVASNVLHADSPATFDLLDHLMREGGIDLVLSGHNHFYERRRLLDGIQYLTVGSNGHVSDEVEIPPDDKRAAGYNRACAFAWMEVTENTIHIRAMNEYGGLIDEFRLGHDDVHNLRVTEAPPRPRDWTQGLPAFVRLNCLIARQLAAGIARAR